MATIGQVSGFSANGRYRHQLTATVVSQDKIANTSRIDYEYVVDSMVDFSNGSWTTLNDTFFNVWINGVVHGTAPNFDFRVDKRLVAVSGSITVSHNSDGTLPSMDLRLACSANPGSAFFQAVDFTGDMDLPTIPRASKMTVSPNPVIEGGDVTITFDRAVNTYIHDITWVSGASSGTIALNVTTSTTWTPDPALLGGNTKVPITITAQTQTAGGTNIGAPISTDIMLIAVPDYPEIGQGTPYDIRFRRIELVGGKLTAKENIPFLEATITDDLSASSACSLTVSSDIYPTNLDEAVVVADVYDGAQWLNVNMLLVLTRTESDDTDMAQVPKYTGMSYVDYILSKGLVEQDNDFPPTWPANILYQYINGAKTRGWGPQIAVSFTGTTSSLGTPWQNETDLSATENTPYLQLLEGFVSDALVEYRTHLDVASGKGVLDIYNPGYGADWTITGANPIVNLATAALFKVADRAPVRKDFSEKLTRVKVTGDEASISRESASAVNPIFGHLEGSVSASGVKETSKLSQLGESVLSQNESATIERTYTYDLSSTQTPPAIYPYRTFRPGDWILVPSDSGHERVRVAQVAITRDVEGTKATITVGDLIPSGVAATARKLTQAGGGAIAGGSLRAPTTLNSAIPAAPLNVDATPGGYWDEFGTPRAGVDLTWNAVTTSLSGSSILVDLYEVWSRQQVGAPWGLVTLSDDLDATISNLDIRTDIDFRVRARSTAGVFGAWSDPITVSLPEPASTLDGPVISDIYTDGVGSIYVVWGGLLGPDVPPVEFAYVAAELSTDGVTYGGTVGTPIVAPGTIVINPGAYDDYFVRLRAYDKLGNPGAVGTAEEISLTDPHVNPEKPLPPANLVSDAGAAWNADGINLDAWFDLDWDVVDEDTDGDPITLAGYDVWGKRSTDPVDRFITSVNTNSARIPVAQGETWGFQVRAASDFGGVSDFSTTVVDTADATVSAPDAPDAPTLQQYMGILKINWSGNGMVPEIKYAYVSISTDNVTYTRAGMPLIGAGDANIANLAPGVYYAKVTLVDELGQETTSTASAPITLLPPTGVTIQTSPIANTGIKMTDASLTAYGASGTPTFILDATTGEVWIGAYDAVFNLGATGTKAESPFTSVTGVSISSENSSFNTFIHPSGLQIRNDQTALSWWEADASDANLVNFFSPRAYIKDRLRTGDYEAVKESMTTGTRLVYRYKGA